MFINIDYDDECKKALITAAKALRIAADWHLPDVQADPPKEWNLPVCDEMNSAEDGWCSTDALAKKLEELVENEKTDTNTDILDLV